MENSIVEKKKKIKFLVMDIDGTLTDGKIYIGDDGEVMKAFNVKDGCGIKDILPKYNIIPMIVTGRNSKIATVRCNELEIEYLYQGIREKEKFLGEFLDKGGYGYQNVAYIGDDILDLECIRKCGISGCPKDSIPEVLSLADFIADDKGGEGAVRSFIDWLVKDLDALS